MSASLVFVLLFRCATLSLPWKGRVVLLIPTAIAVLGVTEAGWAGDHGDGSLPRAAGAVVAPLTRASREGGPPMAAAVARS